MDSILLKEMVFYGYHGVLPEEKRLGQKFIVDVTLHMDLKAAGKSDNLEMTVSYHDVYIRVKDICENERFDLIEALAQRISDKILNDFYKVEEVEVAVKKPQAPIEGIFDYMQVAIRRNRND
ncbi:dihydroneopterin aldolase FolB [Peptoclostridium acidaminophilum DSM 3953]|uniref:7,8-dihydroneopterin aldolase n=1 Tax=Peptoclostridium acidaminophilum DSM 3953 TaxID=1286171 RepID=W8TLD3_PEPAC|nr:dihydroneopterin aldolase [Peptoclostridium acidaminophilum]AHM57007.1 dihydroneopterin aldolase FolB [Peptoclostridium acidaminophilum DSM 3953]